MNLYPWKFGGSHVQSWAAATCASARDETLILVCASGQGASGTEDGTRTIYGSEMAAAILRGGNYAIESNCISGCRNQRAVRARLRRQ